MLNKLLFHERCNDDVSLLAKKITLIGEESLIKFQEQLLDIYQLIYENRNSGTTLLHGSIEHFLHYRDIRFIEIREFDCYVIYKIMPHAVVIVLGIIARQRPWDDLSKIDFSIIPNI
jgi:hypothetical protein